MDYEKLKLTLSERKDLSALRDCFDLCRETEDHILTQTLRKNLSEMVRSGVGAEALELYNKTLLFDAHDSFDCFMRYIECRRPLEQQFWLPRRSKLLHICNALQELEDGTLDELFLSQPPRTGKTTMMVMFLAWVMGRDSERSNLYCSYTDSVVGAFYNGVVTEILGDRTTYLYYDVFPNSKVVSTNAKDLTMNLDRKKRYASLTGRSLYGTLNGACDCDGYMVADDLVSGIEEAMSKDRLANVWAKVDNNLLPRAKEGARCIWEGTRWSLLDPAGIRMDLLQNDERYRERRWRVLNTPALDDNEESNFSYSYGVGFSTDYYLQRRASFERNNDMASWLAQYQGEPIERDGAVFAPEDMRYYNGVLPEGNPDRIFMAVDPAYGGGDFTAAPVCVQYGDDVYVVDVVYDNGEKTITQPLIVHAVEKYHVAAMKVEGTKMTAAYGEAIDKMLRDKGIRINMEINVSHFTGKGKEMRIFDKAPDIREKFIFLQEGKRSKPYSLFMQNIFSFTVNGKNRQHDDAPDVMAIAADYVSFGGRNIEILKRPF